MEEYKLQNNVLISKCKVLSKPERKLDRQKNIESRNRFVSYQQEYIQILEYSNKDWIHLTKTVKNLDVRFNFPMKIK